MKLIRTLRWSVLIFAIASSLCSANAEVEQVSFSPPEYIERPAPKYPKSQLRKGSAGAVEVSLMVGLDGRPFDIVVLRSSDGDFEETAVRAVEKYVYSPALLDGVATETQLKVVVYYEVEGQSLNAVGRSFHKHYKKLSTSLSNKEQDQAKLYKQLRRLAKLARTNCEHKLTTLVQSQYLMSFGTVDEQIESLRKTFIFNRGYSRGQCLNDQILAYAKFNLIKLLIDNQHYGDALNEFDTLHSLSLNNVVSAFSESVKALSNDPDKVLPVSREIIVSRRGVFETAIFSDDFSFQTDRGKINELALRCKNGFYRLQLHDANNYSVPSGSIGCRLLITAEPKEKLVLIEK